IAVTHPKFSETPHEDMRYNDTNLRLNIEFIWRPLMDQHVAKLLNHLKRRKSLPKLIVMGSATHAIKNSNGSALALEEYKKNLTLLSSVLHQIGNKTQLLWMLQDPVVPERLKPERLAITNDQLDLYNMAAMEVLYNTKVHIWSSSRLVAQGSIGGFSDGIHAGEVAIKYDTQILMNLYCNDHLNFNDGTCCNSREAVTVTQIATFAALCSCPIILIAVAVKQWLCVSTHINGKNSTLSSADADTAQPLMVGDKESKKKNDPSSQDFLMALGKLGLIMGYFFLCDRTSLFMKENKYFSQLNFWLPLGYVFALGLFFTEDTSQTRLLHRDMTDEWRGWMQLVILIYHMTGASQVLPIYMHIRVLVSAYLFLTGYGHFSYYWSGRDMGIVRYCQVFFEKIFVMRPWKALFVTTDDDIHEWWFRWQLDRYSLLYGMIFALLYNGLAQYSLIDDKSGSNLMGGRLALLVSFIATVFIASYSTMTLICTNKPDCNEIHPYVAWVPILGFIVLRNMVGILRTRYSSFFAWFGRISLELFVCQYHIWLAADTHGVLVLIPSYPVANVLVTSFIFICVCHEIHHITNKITPFLVPNDSLRAVRNLSVFGFLLMAIGVHDGVF
ncbi:hypothetical protein OTU49_010911, partial [Cherax quadricarinatus]